METKTAASGNGSISSNRQIKELFESDGRSTELLNQIVAEVTKVTTNIIVPEVFKKVSAIEDKFKENQKESLLKIETKANEKLASFEEKIQASSDAFPKIIEEAAKKILAPKLVVLPPKSEQDIQRPQVVHQKFDELAELVNEDIPTMLKGPAGSGKNHTLGQVAQALKKKMFYTNNASNEFKLTGFKSASGEYQPTEFYKAFKNGGIFFLDEIDTSDPTALITLNAAIANGYMAFPHETIDRHKDFRIVAAGNTWGSGANSEYVGRTQLDASTLDRFYMMDFPYDKGVEKAICPDESILEFMWGLRQAAEENMTRMIVSTRGIDKFYKLSKTKIKPQQIIRGLIIKGQNKDTVEKIIGNLKQNKDMNNNEYFKALENIR